MKLNAAIIHAIGVVHIGVVSGTSQDSSAVVARRPPPPRRNDSPGPQPWLFTTKALRTAQEAPGNRPHQRAGWRVESAGTLWQARPAAASSAGRSDQSASGSAAGCDGVSKSQPNADGETDGPRLQADEATPQAGTAARACSQAWATARVFCSESPRRGSRDASME